MISSGEPTPQHQQWAEAHGDVSEACWGGDCQECSGCRCECHDNPEEGQ